MDQRNAARGKVRSAAKVTAAVREFAERAPRLLFDKFARKSEAKDADRRAVDSSDHRPEVLDNKSVPVAQRVLAAERHRVGLDGTSRR